MARGLAAFEGLNDDHATAAVRAGMGSFVVVGIGIVIKCRTLTLRSQTYQCIITPIGVGPPRRFTAGGRQLARWGAYFGLWLPV